MNKGMFALCRIIEENIPLTISMAIIVIGIVLLIIRRFRNKITKNTEFSTLLTYISLIISLASFIFSIIAVPSIYHIAIQIKRERQLEEKIEQLGEKIPPTLPIEKDTVRVVLRDTVKLIVRDTVKVYIKDSTTHNTPIIEEGNNLSEDEKKSIRASAGDFRRKNIGK
jgi:membrane protein implicated in regulation of membrane protease activity